MALIRYSSSSWCSRRLSERGNEALDRNPESPWNPRVPTDITPEDFEKLVLSWLQQCNVDASNSIQATHLGVVNGEGGTYKIDVLVTMTLFGGAQVTVLVECKRHKRPVEREDIMVLDGKLRAVGAHKGMFFSTSGFQSGALQYAGDRGIATIAIVNGEWLYETKSLEDRPVNPPSWAKFDAFAGIRMAFTETGISCSTIEMARLDPLREWFEG